MAALDYFKILGSKKIFIMLEVREAADNSNGFVTVDYNKLGII